jgi:nitroreductase
MEPGLYWLAAEGADPAQLRAAMRPEFTWDRPTDCPDELALYHLVSADARKAAMRLGCHQQICAQSAFALAMLGELDSMLGRSAAGYDALLREAGRIGQALYLNAAAEGIGASGIGCFFDDPLRDLVGLADQRLQPLYMFTAGPALPELGLIDEPAYDRGGE